MTENEFDIKIRSLMENAAEEVPDGVWEGVSDALDKAEGRKRRIVPVFWWRIAGVASLAAAVALAVFLWPEKKGSFTVLDQPEKASVALVEENAADIPADPCTEPVRIEPVRTEAVRSVESALSASAPARSVAPDEAADGSTEAKPQAPANPAPTPAVTDSQPETAEPSEESILRYPEWDEAPSKPRSGGRLALNLGGSALATGRPSAGQGGPVRKFSAPLRAPAATGVTSAGKQSVYGMPFTVGVGIRYTFADRFSIGTGIQYSLLTRSFAGTYNEVRTTVENGVERSAVVRSITTDMDNDQHYIGIPLTFSYDFVQTRRVRAYVQAGGTVEKNVMNHYRFATPTEKISYSEKVKGVQWSVGAGLGVEVMISPYFGFYVDPGVRYYFKGNQPQSLRTAQPWMVDLNAGFRFHL